MNLAWRHDISVKKKYPVGRIDLPRGAIWTSEEHRTLTDGLARGLTILELHSLLPGRTQKAIELKQGFLNARSKEKAGRGPRLCGQRRWTQEEIRQLDDFYWKGLKYAEIASKLNRTSDGVHYQVKKLLARRNGKDPGEFKT